VAPNRPEGRALAEMARRQAPILTAVLLQVAPAARAEELIQVRAERLLRPMSHTGDRVAAVVVVTTEEQAAWVKRACFMAEEAAVVVEARRAETAALGGAGSLSSRHTSDVYFHRAEVKDSDSPNVFRWHFQRGILAPRMSGLELSSFVLSQMPSIIPLLGHHPQIQAEFRAMMVLLATSPKSAIDEVLKWIRSVTREADDDVIELSLYATKPQADGPLYFDMGN
jgi:hypothetical protein